MSKDPDLILRARPLSKDSKSRYIKRQFIISAVIITALLVVLPLVTVFLLTRAYDEQIRTETARNSTSISLTVHTFMQGVYSLCYELAENPAMLSMDPEVQTSILANCAVRNDHMELLYVTGMGGMQTARSSGEPGDRSGRWWFIQMMETRKPFVSKSYYSVTTGMPCTAVFIPMYNDSGMTGIFGVDISLESLQSLIDRFTNIESGQYSFIIDGEGVVIAHHDEYILETLTNYKTLERTVPMLDQDGTIMRDSDDIITTKEDFTVSNDFKAVIDDVMSGNSGLELVEFDGVTHYASYEPVSLPGHSDSWSVITLQNRATAMGVVSQLVIQEVIVIFLIMIIFVALIYNFFKSLRNTLDFLENAKSEADRANNSKSAFLATMSHEIRTPLNAIIGITQVQLQRRDLPGEYHAVWERIYNSGNSLLKIINDILDLSKIETGKLDIIPEVYAIPSLINDTVQLNIVRIGEKKIEFILDLDDDLPSEALGDGLRVKQVLNNLISNAIKYTHEGYVKLTVLHSVNADDLTLFFQIEDTGQGLSYKDQKLVFSEYARFNIQDNTFTEGTGLGLTITKKLTEMMGGEITVNSQLGKGSVFSVSVLQKIVDCEPIGADVADKLRCFTYRDQNKALSHIDYSKLPHGNVLVVDDLEINLYVAEAALKPYGLDIELVDSGFAAIENVINGKTYDIIFMDHMMPEMDGVATTEALRDMGYTGTIVALTANALVGNDGMFSERGFDGYISKPIDIHDLDTLLRKFIKR